MNDVGGDDDVNERGEKIIGNGIDIGICKEGGASTPPPWCVLLTRNGLKGGIFNTFLCCFFGCCTLCFEDCELPLWFPPSLW